MGILRAMYLKQNIGGNVDIFLQSKGKLTYLQNRQYSPKFAIYGYKEDKPQRLR